MAVEPVDEVRNHLSDIIDRVELRRERVTVTRDGRAVAVILSPEDLAELEESLAVLSDPQALPTSVKPTPRTQPVMSSA